LRLYAHPVIAVICKVLKQSILLLVIKLFGLTFTHWHLTVQGSDCKIECKRTDSNLSPKAQTGPL